MDLKLPSCWNSILEKVTPHIPTIDLNLSPPDEIITIYQRPVGLSLDCHEDPDSFSVEDADLEDLLKPLTCQSEEPCILRAKLSEVEIVESSVATQQGNPHCDNDAGNDSTPVVMNGAKPYVSVMQDGDNSRPHQGFPRLSFAKLDLWDLDNVLQNMKKDELPIQQHVSVDSVKTHAKYVSFDGDKQRCRSDIMERLVAFCKTQTSKHVSEPVKSPPHRRQNNVGNVKRMAAELKQSYEECPTVFIDLRCSESSVKSLKIFPNLSSESKSHSTHTEVQPAKNPHPKVFAKSWIDDREVTGKSMLLHKIREINSNDNKYRSKCTNIQDSILRNEDEDLKEMTHQPFESSQSHNPGQLLEDKRSSAVQSASKKPKMGILSTVEPSSPKESKQQGGYQRHQLKQSLKYKEQQQILKQLEIQRPSNSVCQRQPAAERTDVLYDFEVSHLRSISMLPEGFGTRGCMLLIVNLSSPGVVEVHGKRKHLYPAATKSYIYNTLVAWFLSLVCPSPHDDEYEDAAKVPFRVAGLQQLWTGDGLALHVLAVARHCYTPRRRDIDIHAPFYKHVLRFLSETSLTQIAHWLPNLKLLLDKQAFPSLIHLPPSSLNCFIFATSNKKVIDETFSISPEFYWQTVETQECVCNGRESTQELHTEVSSALWCNGLFLHPVITHYILQLVVNSGLDVCGLRLLYPPQSFLTDSTGGVAFTQRVDETCQPILALAVRGPHAFSVFKDLTGYLYPLLPIRTDSSSVSHLQCRSQKPCVFYSPPLASQVHRELCLWFSGRLQEESAQNCNQQLKRFEPLDDGVRSSLSISVRSSAFLCATTKADILLVVSPAVPSLCYGHVLAVCERRGFSLKGLQSLQLQNNGAALLGLTNKQVAVFCSSPIVTLDQGDLPSQCLVVLLRKENAMHHSFGLPAALMREFTAQNLLGGIGVQAVEPSFCFHTVAYSSKLFPVFVKCMWSVPDPSGIILSHQKNLSNYDMEQVVILTLSGKDMSLGLRLLHQVLAEGPDGDAGFKLLGLKWLPVLTRLQAQELSPYEVGEQHFYDSLESLMSSPALVCALRRMDAFALLRKCIQYHSVLSVLMSPTPQAAFRQASLFFDL